MSMKPRALLISGYHAISQKQWADYVMATCEAFQWSCIALPARYFSWRMRGAPLSIAAQDAELLTQHFDLLLVTSSVDLSIVQSLYPSLRNTPSILYFHENQFAYPESNKPHSVIDWQMVNLYSALRADKILFNSNFNQTSFTNGAKKLLKKLPDLVPANLIDSIAQKSSVLAVPIKQTTAEYFPKEDCLTLLWNHRWEWDKCPELLLAITETLIKRNINFKLVITGQQFRSIPVALEKLLSDYPEHIKHAGFIEHVEAYRKQVAACHVVLSTAIHEFQGIAIMEAVAAGCVPLLPNRLSYPEYFPKQYLYKSAGDLQQQAESACNLLQGWIKKGLPVAPTVNNFLDVNLTTRYQTEISANIT